MLKCFRNRKMHPLFVPNVITSTKSSPDMCLILNEQPLHWEAIDHNKQISYMRRAQNGHKSIKDTHTHQTKNKHVPINNDVITDPDPSKTKRNKNMTLNSIACLCLLLYRKRSERLPICSKVKPSVFPVLVNSYNVNKYHSTVTKSTWQHPLESITLTALLNQPSKQINRTQ